MTRQFKVSCDDCQFERQAASRDDAEAIALEHHDETDHEIVAVEVPA